MTDETCIFCAIVHDKAPARVLARDEATMTILDIAPATRGHALVIPIQHFDTLLDTPESVAGQLMQAGHSTMRLLNDTLAPDGFTLALMVNSVGWQTVFHVHLHVIPRYVNDGLAPPWVERRAAERDLDEVFSAICP